jgi:hypothetical protein
MENKMNKLSGYSQNGKLIEIGKKIKENRFCRLLSFEDFIKYLDNLYEKEKEQARSVSLMCDYIMSMFDKEKYERIVEFIEFLKTKTIPFPVARTVLFVTSKLKSPGLRDARVDYANHVRKVYHRVKDIEKILEKVI